MRGCLALDEVSEWCLHWLGSAVEDLLFEAGFSSQVFGVRLADQSSVVVRIRASQPRLLASARVQRHLWQQGFACPEPLTEPTEFAGVCVSAEALVEGGSVLTADAEAPSLYASALADLIRRAPRVDSLPRLDPPPTWAHWNHLETGLWPRDARSGVDLNAESDPAWLSDAAKRVRRRLHSFQRPNVVGHADWWSENLRWLDHRLHVVFDWDSVTAQAEAILAGYAAYMFAATTYELDGCAPGASVEETERFLAAYEKARGRPWTADEREAAWAAGLWVAAYHARLSRLEDRGEGFAELVRAEAAERLWRAGA